MFINVHRRCTGNFAPKVLRTGTAKRFCCDLYGTGIFMKLYKQLGLGILLNVAGTIANILGGIVICEIVLTNMCSGGNVDI